MRHGSASNPPNRFERLHYDFDDPACLDGRAAQDERPDPAVQYFRDPSRSIIATNGSPDVGFDASVNPYRGCAHACAYCYARPSHEYLGLSAGLDFETRIFVKERASELLRRELAAPKWQPQVLALSGVTDPYQPIERKLELTRRCLAVLLEARNPVAVVTKGRLVARDADLLAELARHDCASVSISITTLDTEVHRAMEPRTPRPELRLAAIEALARAGVPVGVLVAPVVPGLTDHELPRILAAAARAGASHAGYVVLRLPHGLTELFEAWLERSFPERKDKVLGRLRALHGGALYDPRFGARQRGAGPFAEQIAQLFAAGLRRARMADMPRARLSIARFRRPRAPLGQLALL
jgi:DNA repair photolyase